MLRQKLSPKNKLNQTLRSWLPILQSSLDELDDTLKDFIKDNPFVNICHRRQYFGFNTNLKVDLAMSQISLYEYLISQISPPLFPTKRSQEIAFRIIENINTEGYFECEDLDNLSNFSLDEIEKIRVRFSKLDPVGVGAKNYKEAFLFQLEDLDVEYEIYEQAKIIIDNFENLKNFRNLKYYSKAMDIIKRFKNPPAIEFLEQSASINADVLVITENNNIKLMINDDYYPEILLDIEGQNENEYYIKQKIKEAKNLTDALEMRKTTLYKIALAIIEYQYDYFFGGDIKPMNLSDIADDLGRNQSTISRAIANKFLHCSRGLIPFKIFFASAISSDVSNMAIKDFIINLVKSENRLKPFSDIEILELVGNHFGVKMVRRTITKYRQALNIASSSERKKNYEISGEI